jgi:hypothetical protein
LNIATDEGEGGGQVEEEGRGQENAESGEHCWFVDCIERVYSLNGGEASREGVVRLVTRETKWARPSI